MQLRPVAGFDWTRVMWGRPDSPRSALCSYCLAAVGADEMPLMLWNADGWAAQFCARCQRRWWGFQTFEPEGADD